MLAVGCPRSAKSRVAENSAWLWRRTRSHGSLCCRSASSNSLATIEPLSGAGSSISVLSTVGLWGGVGGWYDEV